MLANALVCPGADAEKSYWCASARQLIEDLLMHLDTEIEWRSQGDGYCESTCAPNEITEGSRKSGRRVRRMR
jgi:hypothetical protein